MCVLDSVVVNPAAYQSSGSRALRGLNRVWTTGCATCSAANGLFVFTHAFSVARRVFRERGPVVEERGRDVRVSYG